MSEQNEKLTALFQSEAMQKVLGIGGCEELQKRVDLVVSQQVEHATAELSAKNEFLREELAAANAYISRKNIETAELRKELDEVKKENQEWKARNLEYSYKVAVGSCVILDKQLAEAQRQRDEADNLLAELYENGQGSYGTPLEIAKRVKSYLDSRLSSGETKVESLCPHGIKSTSFCIDCIDESLTDKTE